MPLLTNAEETLQRIIDIMETKKVHFPILIEQDEDNIYIVSCPVFKGCHSYGKTIEEAMMNIEEAIELYIEDETPVAA